MEHNSGSSTHQTGFIKPSTKLEDIENSLNMTNLEVLDASLNHPVTGSLQVGNASLSTSNIITCLSASSTGLISNIISTATSPNLAHLMLKATAIDNTEKYKNRQVLSLQRSISEKLRNSFKNTTTNLNILKNNPNGNSRTGTIEPRKWHSERYKNNRVQLQTNKSENPTSNNYNSMKPAYRFSTQAPLHPHHQAILEKYTKKPIPTATEQPSSPVNQLTRKFSRIKMKKKQNPTVKLNKPSGESRTDEIQNDSEESEDDDEDEIDPYDPFSRIRMLIAVSDQTNKNLADKEESSSSDSEDDNTDVNNNTRKKKSATVKRNDIDWSSTSDEEDDDDVHNCHNHEQSPDNLPAKINILLNSADPNMPTISDLNTIDLLTENAPNQNIQNLNSYPANTEDSYFYERVTSQKYECKICFEKKHLNERSCCKFVACNRCINYYIHTQIKQCCGNVRIECINSKCTKLILRDEISERMSRFDKDTLKIYFKFLVDANKDSNCKTCPRCSHIMKLDDYKFSQTNVNNNNVIINSGTKNNNITKVQCQECQLIWCFFCHAPWHDGITCSEFRKGDRMLRYWAKEVHYGQQNAQLCPKCKIYIQRTKGCDHMVCTYCQTEFCYKCGGRFRRLKFVGDHYSKFSILGCKYRFYPEKPTKRKLIRGSILGVKIIAAPLVASLGLVVGVGVLAAGCVALPVYGSYKLAKHIKLNHSNKIRKSSSLTGVFTKRSNDSTDNIINNSLLKSCSVEENISGFLNKYKAETGQVSLLNLPSSSGYTGNSNLNNNLEVIKSSVELNLIPREASQNQKLMNMVTTNSAELSNDISEVKKNQ